MLGITLDPLQRYPVGHRLNAWLASSAQEGKA